MEEITNLFDISNNVIIKAKESEEDIETVFKDIENIALYNQAKVIKAFKEYQVSRYAFWKNNWIWI